MAAVNERLESSSEEEIDCCYSSSNESFEGEEGACGYTREPEYSKAELIKLGIKVIEDDDDSEDTSGDDDLDLSRLENMHWCSCAHCCIMPSLRECNAVESALICWKTNWIM